MKVNILTWHNKAVVGVRELAEALRPDDSVTHDGGVTEATAAKVDACARSIGLLLEFLVGTGALTLDRAQEIAGNNQNLELPK